MTEPSTGDLQAHLQALLNCVALCGALKKQTNDPYVRDSLGSVVDGLQESLAILANYLRRRGVAPGTWEVDSHGQVIIRETLKLSLPEQLPTVRGSLADLVAWYDGPLSTPQAARSNFDWLLSLSMQAHRLLEEWDHHMHEMKAG
jgi:hypothetical protein